MPFLIGGGRRGLGLNFDHDTFFRPIVEELDVVVAEEDAAVGDARAEAVRPEQL